MFDAGMAIDYMVSLLLYLILLTLDLFTKQMYWKHYSIGKYLWARDFGLLSSGSSFAATALMAYKNMFAM